MKNKQKAWRLGAIRLKAIRLKLTDPKARERTVAARNAKALCTALGMALRDPKRHRPA